MTSSRLVDYSSKATDVIDDMYLFLTFHSRGLKSSVSKFCMFVPFLGIMVPNFANWAVLVLYLTAMENGILWLQVFSIFLFRLVKIGAAEYINFCFMNVHILKDHYDSGSGIMVCTTTPFLHFILTEQSLFLLF